MLEALFKFPTHAMCISQTWLWIGAIRVSTSSQVQMVFNSEGNSNLRPVESCSSQIGNCIANVLVLLKQGNNNVRVGMGYKIVLHWSSFGKSLSNLRCEGGFLRRYGLNKLRIRYPLQE